MFNRRDYLQKSGQSSIVTIFPKNRNRDQLQNCRLMQQH